MRKLMMVCWLITIASTTALTPSLTFAQVDENLNARLQESPIIVDHTSLPLFDQIPDTYIQQAENIRLMWGDRSVGGNISSGLDCLTSESDEVTPINSCTRNTHPDPAFISPQSLMNWYRPGGYSRVNWTFYFDPGLGVTPELSCSTSNGLWDGLVGCFIEHIRANSTQYNVMSYQHSYLTLYPGSTIASPTTGYFVNQTTKTDIYDYQQLETDFPDQVFFYQTTSLARGLGTQEGTDYNSQMRLWATQGHKILFDVADIESHEPWNSSPCFDNRDGVEYCSSTTNCENYPDDGLSLPAICQHYTTELNGGHLYDPAKIALAKSYWVLMAQIAGWEPGVIASPSPSTQPGDATGDGLVNSADTFVWNNYYSLLTTNFPQANFNSDSKTNSLDFGFIFKNWQ